MVHARLLQFDLRDLAARRGFHPLPEDVTGGLGDLFQARRERHDLIERRHVGLVVILRSLDGVVEDLDELCLIVLDQARL